MVKKMTGGKPKKEKKLKGGKSAEVVGIPPFVSKLGRPTLYRPEFCDIVIECGREGDSKAQIAALLDVNRETLDCWAKEHQDFSDAMKRARELSLAWWDSQGKKGVWGGKEFNANAYRLQVCNRFPDDYRDKQVVEHSGNIGLDERILRARKRVDGE